MGRHRRSPQIAPPTTDAPPAPDFTEKGLRAWVATAQPGEMLWERDTIPGFGARRWARFATYVLAYRHGRRQRWLTLGKVGVRKLDAAQKAAREALGEVAAGRDPAAARDEGRHAESVRELGEKWLEHVASLRKPSTAREYAAVWYRHLAGRLGSLPARDVSRADVARVHAALKGTPIEANRVLAVCSSFMTWCERTGVRPVRSNPCFAVPRYRETARTRFLTEPELHRLGKALAEAERTETVTLPDKRTGTPRTEPVSLTALRIIRLLALTGARLSEIRGLRWDALDFDAGTARLHDSKTGPRTLVLAQEALDVLASVPRFVSAACVFPQEGTRRRPDAPFVNVHRTWALVRRSADLPDLRLHDLRHSAASVAAGAGVSLRIIGAVLGHTQASTTQRYAHVAPSPAAEAASLISKHVSRALKKGARQAGRGKVLPMRQRRGA